MAAGLLTAAMLCVVQLMVERPMLMAERLFPGTGWLEIIALALYAAFMAPKILNPATTARWRTMLWLTFSIFFFGQLLLGLLGFESFLLSGTLHLPIPALIVAGPVYRGETFFMPILFTATLLFIGPAWCSYFCYLGGWDLLASQQKKRPKSMPGWRQSLRLAIFMLIIAVAWILGRSGSPVNWALWVAVLYALGGLVVMFVFSRQQGVMVHCTTYCPVGLVANICGRISPFRLRVDNSCTACHRCISVCRYDALKPENLQLGKPGFSCTLCGDCLGSCRNKSIHYNFPGLSQEMARVVFVVFVVSFHAVSIGVARI